MQIQRKLQLQIEEQGKYLEKMFDQQKQMENKFKASSSTSSDSQEPLSNIVHQSTENNKSEISEQVPPTAGASSSDANSKRDDSFKDPSEKQKAHETESCEEHEPGNGESVVPPTKRARHG